MIGLLRFVLAILVSPLRSKSRLEAENAALRHQLIVLRRNVRGKVRLTTNGRCFLIQLYRWFPSILRVLSRSSVPRRSCGGLVQVFAGTSGEGRVRREGGLKSRQSSAR